MPFRVPNGGRNDSIVRMLQILCELYTSGWQAPHWNSVVTQGAGRLSTPKAPIRARVPVAQARGTQKVPPSLAVTVPLQNPFQVWRAALLRPVVSHLIILTPPHLAVEETRRGVFRVMTGEETEALPLILAGIDYVSIQTSPFSRNFGIRPISGGSPSDLVAWEKCTDPPGFQQILSREALTPC